MSKTIERLKDLETQFKLLSENSIDAIWIVDVGTLKFEYITESIEKLSGHTPDEYIHFSLQERIKLESFQKIRSMLAEEIPKYEKGKKSVTSIEVELIHKTGKCYWGEIRAKLFKGAEGKLKIIGVTKDITKRKEAEHGKNELIQKLNAALKEKEKLLTENKILRGLLPICSACKRIRDANGKWWPLDAYIERATDVELSHTICLDCKEAFYGDEDWYIKHKKKAGKK